ncbi:PIN domain-containing protein [Calothrix sp. PCC 7507]|uniref:type II toxin-antitoxin system VapC family toxin n=1 Tax=Calothrix sp. PCC 7507 TaxID=99598 RepID=UPI001F1DBFA9|nr:PIN domain-containing protein [Calothrix sp. PCC 7507]
MKILIDTNVVLDLLLEREPFVENAIALFEQIEQGNLEGFITATTITNIFYIIRQSPDHRNRSQLGTERL